MGQRRVATKRAWMRPTRGTPWRNVEVVSVRQKKGERERERERGRERGRERNKEMVRENGKGGFG